jgi:hypothetical protein
MMNRRGIRDRLTRRAPDPATVAAEKVTEEWVPEPMGGNHQFDYTADDFAQPPTVFMPPELTHLAAMLSGFSGERVQVLREASTPNGWPEWWSRRFYGDDPEAWEGFKSWCFEALENFHTSGIPIENTLLACVQDMERERRDAA